MTAPRRRQRLSSEERRAQLVDATVAELAANGFAGTTADAIAKRAGVSKGLLWHHFDDLDHLLEHTARQTLMALALAVAAGLDLSAPAPGVIRSAIRGAADLRRTHGAQRAAMTEIVSNLRAPDGALRFGQSDYEPLYRGQEGIFRRGQDEGDFDTNLDPRVMAVTYQGAVDSMLAYLDSHPELDADDYAGTLADILLGGISKRSSTPRARR